MTSKNFTDVMRDGSMGMMGMMAQMMDDGRNLNGRNLQSFDMWEMWRQMMSFRIPDNAYSASPTFATAEIKVLFEEWLEQIEMEVIEFTKGTSSVDPEAVAFHLKISRNSAEYLISRVEQKKKFNKEETK